MPWRPFSAVSFSVQGLSCRSRPAGLYNSVMSAASGSRPFEHENIAHSKVAADA